MPTREDLLAIDREIQALKKRRVEIIHAIPHEPVSDYTFETLHGPVRLSELFDERPDLFVVHNMGRSCRWCTLWADGLAGLYGHLSSRAPFVLSSPDSPQVQAEFAASRGWPFRMLSTQGSSFAKDMGYMDSDGDPGPGVSVFHRLPSGQIVRTGHDRFGPGDDYCALWPLFDMLKGGVADWEPQYRYETPVTAS
ncbi:MAG TPA: DUF899 family protein [Phycisphaerales bacterium]|nr:DUF899 family protein [Phycisphaerales bacterium]